MGPAVPWPPVKNTFIDFNVPQPALCRLNTCPPYFAPGEEGTSPEQEHQQVAVSKTNHAPEGVIQDISRIQQLLEHDLFGKPLPCDMRMESADTRRCTPDASVAAPRRKLPPAPAGPPPAPPAQDTKPSVRFGDFTEEEFVCYFPVGIERDDDFEVAARLSRDEMLSLAQKAGENVLIEVLTQAHKGKLSTLVVSISAQDQKAFQEATWQVRMLLEDIYEDFRDFCGDHGRPAPIVAVRCYEGRPSGCNAAPDEAAARHASSGVTAAAPPVAPTVSQDVQTLCSVLNVSTASAQSLLDKFGSVESAANEYFMQPLLQTQFGS
eukprot:gnl/TRDRNA2_/TRDRNA2_195837_c0_seq1.p1 gnl/TRDRNA2_/TRDRNA2_195837_c0~~gnl/TRDRNA2_/TRDRNA2_195837_c0_seq1.p1  ORF type:complete len:350 (-),score=68.97 gnl/TRDRNA2_/TRDRNA2_195837_c0_seq1:38-1003(-)